MNRVKVLSSHITKSINDILKDKTMQARFDSTIAANNTSSSLTTTAKKVHLRSEYRPPIFLCSNISLDVSIDKDSKVTIKSTLNIQRNLNSYTTNSKSAPLDLEREGKLVLNAEQLNIHSLVLRDIQSAAAKEKKAPYIFDQTKNEIIVDIPNELNNFLIETIVEPLNPKKNSTLMGLYESNGGIISQCESQGFRRIIPSIDRPDVLSTYKVKITAHYDQYPTLLSNGNNVDAESSHDRSTGLHTVVFNDPVPKPCYLFALIALPPSYKALHDTFINAKGRKVDLRIFSEDVSKVTFAMNSLKQAMKWDEDVFSLTYDWDRMNIVAVESFNFGAMENTSLNVFASKYIIGSPETSLDSELDGILSVVAHEFFHNWTGNRITCQSWFELTLKEGLTVFRDQSFTMDTLSRSVKRIEDVRLLRETQFTEDDSGLSHPIRPDSYESITNFYTTTIYEKGAEVIRMVQTLLGREGFIKGMNNYTKKFDGQAVTCDDWLRSMGEPSGVDFFSDSAIPFTRWYSQKGTPKLWLSVDSSDYKSKSLLKIKLRQDKRAPIPVKIGFLDSVNGNELKASTDLLLLMDDKPQIFDVYIKNASNQIQSVPIISALREFSAPVKLTIENQTLKDLAFLASKDSDGYNKWDAAQRIFIGTLSAESSADKKKEYFDESCKVIHSAIRSVLDSKVANEPSELCSLAALTMELPSADIIAETYQNGTINLSDISKDLRFFRKSVADRYRNDFLQLIDHLFNKKASSFTIKPFEFSPRAIGHRRLAVTALEYLCESTPSNHKEYEKLVSLFSGLACDRAKGMTIRYAGLHALVNSEAPAALKDKVLSEWKEEFQVGARNHDSLVMSKWLRVQATSRFCTLDKVKALMKDKKIYDSKVPDQVRNLIFAYVNDGSESFHNDATYEQNYVFLRDVVAGLDKENPQLAARLAKSMLHHATYEPNRATLMKSLLEDLLQKSLSADTAEIVKACLNKSG